MALQIVEVFVMLQTMELALNVHVEMAILHYILDLVVKTFLKNA